MPRHGESKARVIEILNANPQATNVEIAKILNLSSARVSQVRIQLNRPQGRRGKRSTAPVIPKESWLGTLKTKVKKIVRR